MHIQVTCAEQAGCIYVLCIHTHICTCMYVPIIKGKGSWFTKRKSKVGAIWEGLEDGKGRGEMMWLCYNLEKVQKCHAHDYAADGVCLGTPLLVIQTRAGSEVLLAKGSQRLIWDQIVIQGPTERCWLSHAFFLFSCSPRSPIREWYHPWCVVGQQFLSQQPHLNNQIWT